MARECKAAWVREFPSSFDVNLKSLPKAQLRQRLEKLARKCDTDVLDTSEELTMCYNLQTFLSWLMKKTEDAFMYNDKALAVNPESVIALSNRHRMLTELGRQDEAEVCITELRAIEKPQYQHEGDVGVNPFTAARAELAWTFANFGPPFYRHAAGLYKDVVAEATANTNSVSGWKYGQGLALRRLVHYLRSYHGTDESELWEIQREAALVLSDLTKTARQPLHKARALVQLGEILRDINLCAPENKQYVLPGELLDKDPKCLYDKALGTFRRDTTVLNTCGKFFKNFGMVSEAVALLKESLEIRKTSFAHHHLAVALRKNLRKNTRSAVGQPRFGKQQNYRQNRGGAQTNRQHPGNQFRSSMWRNQPVQHLAESKQTDEILHHLNCALEMGIDTFTLYDKAMLLKDLGKLKEAIDCFEQCTKHNSGSSSVVSVCFEQIGLCHIQIMAFSTNKEDQRCKAKMCMMKALEVAATILPNGSFQSVPAILAVSNQTGNLSRNQKTLSDLVSRYREAFDFFDEMNEDTDAKMVEDMIKDYIRRDDFDNAILLLNLQKCTQLSIDRDAFLKIHIDGALACLSLGDSVLAKIRFQQCFSFQRDSLLEGSSVTHKAGSTDVLCESYDVLVIYEIKSEELESPCVAERINTFLKMQCGLRMLSVSDDFDYKTQSEDALSLLAEKSDHILVVFSDDELSPPFKRTLDVVQSLAHIHKSLLVVQVDDCSVPVDFTHFPAMAIGSESVGRDNMPALSSDGTQPALKQQEEGFTTGRNNTSVEEEIDEAAKAFETILGLSANNTTDNDIPASVTGPVSDAVQVCGDIDWARELFYKLLNVNSL